jgi:hypothetical protein
LMAPAGSRKVPSGLCRIHIQRILTLSALSSQLSALTPDS